MKNYLKYRIPLFILLIIFLIHSCIPNGERKLNKGIELFNEGETEKAIPYIEEGLISMVCLRRINNNNFSYGSNVLYSEAKEAYKILWPVEIEIDVSEGYKIVSISQDAKKIGISNGFDIKIYDTEGNIIKTIGPVKDEKTEVKALIIVNNNVYYFKNKRIYAYDLIADNKDLLVNDIFYKPFTSEIYNVKLINFDDILVLTLGIAGKYNLNIINLTDNSIVTKNVKTASSNITVKSNTIHYVSGDAGKYSLIKSDIRFRKKKEIINFDNLTDIVFFNNGAVYIEKDSMWINNFESGDSQKIHFNYNLAGKCGSNPVFKYLNAYYVMDMLKFTDQINNLKQVMPDIFKD